MKKNLKIVDAFTKTPGPRFIKDGLFSGEQFRKDLLSGQITDAINNGDVLVVDLDGSDGYSRSFLDEAFGGLILDDDLELSEILSHLEIISHEEPYLVKDVERYLKQAQEKKIVIVD